MSSLIVVRESDQSRRELCEDCEHSRGEGLHLKCELKRNTPCQHAAALRDRNSRCPRNEEYAIIWQAATLDPPGRCGDTPSPATMSSNVSIKASELVTPPPSPASMIRGTLPLVALGDSAAAQASYRTDSTHPQASRVPLGAESPIRIHQVAGRRP
ncbi:MAG: hypothetical protein HBSAPP02_23280 [Phycisphaerae bacterium]|nr:MAG: hypothetical protein HBSAPP02_23280 [Phycisphaerae bacterium]